MKYCLSLVFVIFSFSLGAQLKVNLDSFDSKKPAQVRVESNLLQLTWPGSGKNVNRVVLDMALDQPLFKAFQVKSTSGFKTVSAGLDPVFILTVGKRDLISQNGWNIFFDRTAYLPYKEHRVVIEKQSMRIVTQGTRTKLIIGKASAGNFSGNIEITVYENDDLVNISATLATADDSTAIIYDAGLAGKTMPWKKISYSSPEEMVLSTNLVDTMFAKNLAVKYRAIVGETDSGSLAVFPAPHQYFYPLDNCYNLDFTWYGRSYRKMIPEFGIGIRQDLMGDRRWVPWFNAPPGTRQRLNFFCMISDTKDAKILEPIKAYTHNDTYKPLDGYYTMASHFHVEHTDDVLTRKPLPEIPGFVKAFRKTGVNIVHLGEFHGPGDPRGPDRKRLEQLQTLFDECKRLSSGNFLLLPGEEPNNFFGGHWMNIFPKPVYWVMSRHDTVPFVQEHPAYGKVYHIKDKEEMLKLLELEKGLAWTAHARTKGSTGFPDKYKSEKFFKSPHFSGAAWKYIPADLSKTRLGIRIFDLMDDMNNWGQKKTVIAEADLFKIEPTYELYGHLNINYMQLPTMPEFENGWQSLVDAMQKGKFFSSTGEILIPEFSVNEKTAGETVTLTGKNKTTLKLRLDWTFPLEHIGVISGDGEKVYHENISMRDTKSFGSKEFLLPVNLSNRKWVRVEVWDIASNGAFTQTIWIE
jgi:hypothetical protein